MVPGSAPGRGAAAVLHDLEPGRELGDHGVGKSADLPVEPGVDRGGAVLDQDGGGVQDFEHGPDGQVDVLEAVDFAGAHRGPATWLQTEDDADPDDVVLQLFWAPGGGGGQVAGQVGGRN